MTAKETQTSLLNAIRIYAVCKRKDAEWRYSDLLNRLSEHEMQLCKEQREWCAINIDQEAVYCGEGSVIIRILHAPTPEL